MYLLILAESALLIRNAYQRIAVSWRLGRQLITRKSKREQKRFGLLLLGRSILLRPATAGYVG